MDNQKDQNQGQPNIVLRPEIARGIYSNLAIITHAQSEFIIDFAALLPGFPGPEVESRIIMTPEHAKRLLEALANNVSAYEQKFGPIVPDQQMAKKNGATFDLSDLPEFGGGAKS